MKRVTRVPALPRRDAAGHKGSFGTVALLAGSPGMLGAAILSARGALRGGAGLCRACLPRDLMAPFTVAVPAATTLNRTPTLRGFFDSASAVVAGPGLGKGRAVTDSIRRIVRTSTVPAVLDADALNALAPARGAWGTRTTFVGTPHPGEAARLLQSDTATIQSDRRHSAAALADATGQVVVLKGRGTLVCDGRRMFHNKTGNDGLATGGSGDVLAGLIGALLAQSMDPFDAACLGAYLHGKAGDLVVSRLSKFGLTAEDLPLAIAEVMR